MLNAIDVSMKLVKQFVVYIDLFQNILYVVHKEEKLNSIFIIVEYIRIVWVPDSPWMKMNNLA